MTLIRTAICQLSEDQFEVREKIHTCGGLLKKKKPVGSAGPGASERDRPIFLGPASKTK